ncbi:GNAT family N-acetyltransferase [Kineococcus rhizosphaerae]|uniref:RimJ/RimL family protein N-acetyltransferase n=1 Tax=Kineococcus rhizosphaerae TaxID=559628 RepID=A0A2T0R7R6_9ACTN|nr:GNAT family N-acetyltransferase [Kineococcus rhizosphaerae]PRY17209.1 RimJ/RimL family protein N-acetyltransferase [Kineococcus rhizosphaerae]
MPVTVLPPPTPRLVLRRWTAADRGPFAALNADPEVMRYFPSVLDRAASDALADYCDGCFDRLGFGLSAVEHAGEFVGFTGLHRMRWYPDEVEIGWRLARPAWNRGFATEAARAWVEVARGLGLPRLISIVDPDNAASLAVTRKLGMVEGWRAEEEGRPHVVTVLEL